MADATKRDSEGYDGVAEEAVPVKIDPNANIVISSGRHAKADKEERKKRREKEAREAEEREREREAKGDGPEK